MELADLPIILHVGPPKTGSTTLQHHCFPNLETLHFVGKPWFRPELPYDVCVGLHKAVDRVTMAGDDAYDAGAARRLVSNYFDALARHLEATEGPGAFERRRFLLSEERLTHEHDVGLPVIASRLKQLFPRGEIAFVRRDPLRALKSAYVWLYARARTERDFSAWVREGLEGRPGSLATTNLRYYDYSRTSRIFSEIFPTVRAADFSDFGTVPERFFRDLLGEPAVFSGDVSELSARRTNVSQNRSICEMHRGVKKSIRLWNSLGLPAIDEKPEYLPEGGLWRAAEAPLARLRWGEGKFALGEEERAAVLAYYRRHEA